MPFWSGETIEARLAQLFTEYDASRIDCNAYTLRMGTEYFCTSDGTQSERGKKISLCMGDTFSIPPGQFAFLQTLEEVTVPTDAMAFLSMKSKVKWQGLINVSGFHVDPGYRGKLVFAAYNAGSSSIVLEAGMPLFLIWYASLDRNDSKKVKSASAGKTISADLIKNMSDDILSLQAMSKKIESVESKMRYQWTIFGFAFALFSAILFATANFVFQKGLISIIESKPSAGISNSSPPSRP